MLFGELSSSEIGPVYIAATNQGIARVSLWKIASDEQLNITADALQAFQYLTAALTELNLFLGGSLQRFSVPLDLGYLTDFQKLVLQSCINIPYGQLLTYKALAGSIGKPNATRAVASALARNPILLFVPCHRVIGSDARLHGFAAPKGILTKEALLRLEGHSVQNDRLLS